MTGCSVGHKIFAQGGCQNQPQMEVPHVGRITNSVHDNKFETNVKLTNLHVSQIILLYQYHEILCHSRSITFNRHQDNHDRLPCRTCTSTHSRTLSREFKGL